VHAWQKLAMVDKRMQFHRTVCWV